MKGAAYYKDTDINDIEFPVPEKARVAHGIRNLTAIPDYRAVIDKTTGNTFAIVKKGYKIIPHQDIITQMDEICHKFPEYGEPTREIWMSNFGGRMKTRWTFPEVNFAIGNLPDGTPDTVHPTYETMASYDTSLAHSTYIGGIRMICTNGMFVGKLLAKYKRKHTIGLNLQQAQKILTSGMENYSKAQDLWLSYTKRDALLSEVNCYELVGFHKDEKFSIENSIKKQGNVITWDDEDENKLNRNVKINAWELMNILTKEATHTVKDITRQAKIQENIANMFQ